MKNHPDTSLCSELRILQIDIASFGWRIITVDESSGAVHSVVDSMTRYRTRDQAKGEGAAALEALTFP